MVGLDLALLCFVPSSTAKTAEFKSGTARIDCCRASRLDSGTVTSIMRLK